MRLVSSDTAASGDLHEVYTGYSKKDTTGKGTIYYTFTRSMSHIPYTMYHELDSVKQMKVTAISVVHHAVFMKENNVLIQEFTSHNFLRRIEVPEDHEVKRYFSCYRRKTGF